MLFVFLLQLWSLCTAKDVSLVKIIGEEPDVTQICDNQTVDVIMMIRCIVKTAGGKECQLQYNFDNGFESSCDFRITLKQNETMFLQLNKLTPADGGSYNCECTFNGGTHVVQLNVTVSTTEEHAVDNTSPIPMYILIALTSITVLIIGITVTVAIMRQSINIYRRTNPDVSVSFITAATLHSPVNNDQEDTYTALQHPDTDSDLYHDLYTVVLPANRTVMSGCNEDQEMCERPTNVHRLSGTIYENT